MTDQEVKSFVLNRANIFMKSYDTLNGISTLSRTNLILSLVAVLEKDAYCVVSANHTHKYQVLEILDENNKVIYTINNKIAKLEYFFLKKLFLYIDAKKHWSKMYRKFQSAHISTHVKRQ